MTTIRRLGDVVIRPLIRVGAIQGTYLLTTRGRRTGAPHSNPVTLVEHGKRRWLVAPYGPVSWVRNARAAGHVTLRRRGRTEVCTVRELDPSEAAPILKDYLAIARPPRRYFRADRHDPVAAFTAEAAAHPVFELTVIDGGR